MELMKGKFRTGHGPLTFSPLACSWALIHLLADFSGSMHSGKRRAANSMMALSTEKVSFGRPWMTHSRTLTGSPNTEEREKE